MASSWSDLKIQLMATGENVTTWGSITNANMGTAIEDAITGSVDVSFTGSNVTLPWTNTTGAQDFRNLRLRLTGTNVSTTQQITVPNIEKLYIVDNALSDDVIVQSGTGANGTVTVPAGATGFVFCGGNNGVTNAINHLSALTLSTPLPVASGGTGSNSGINVATVSGVLPIANGGTGSATAAFDGSLITNINATSIASGTLDNARTSANTANQANAIVLRDGQGSFTANVVTAASFVGPASGNPTSIVAGTGLTGGGSSGAVTISLNTTAGAVGTYAFLGETTTTDTAVGGTQSGSSLRYSGVSATTTFNSGYKDGSGTGSTGTTNSASGTWQCMGQSGPTTNPYYGLTLWMRIS